MQNNLIYLKKKKNVLFDDEVKRTREIEKKKWLQDLEEQKRQKQLESSRQQNNRSEISTKISSILKVNIKILSIFIYFE